MPNTYMNDSGRAIRSALDWFDLDVSQVLVIVDDIDLPLGHLRFRTKGSSGGHNGIKSTINHLGTQDFCRLRVGIGAPSLVATERKVKTVSHVLGDFNSKELTIITKTLEEVITGLGLINQIGIEKLSHRLNSYKPNLV